MAAATPQDPATRIRSSLDVTLGLKTPTLPSYHLEQEGFEPVFIRDTNQVQTETFTLKADVAGDDVHFVSTRTVAGRTRTLEGYVIKGGIAKGGKEYTVEGGRVQEALLPINSEWEFASVRARIPLIAAATGQPEAQGEDSFDGRAATKFQVDSGSAPPATVAAVGRGAGFAVTNATALAWIDRETGALMKLLLSFDESIFNPPTSQTEVGKDRGRVELTLTQVGKVTVKLP